jgi:hypothetical protein
LDGKQNGAPMTTRAISSSLIKALKESTESETVPPFARQIFLSHSSKLINYYQIFLNFYSHLTTGV